MFTNSAPFVYPAQMRRCSTSTPGRAAVTGGLTVTLWRPAGSFHPANNGNLQTLLTCGRLGRRKTKKCCATKIFCRTNGLHFIALALYFTRQTRTVPTCPKECPQLKAAGVRPVHLVSALLHHERMVIGQRQVDQKTNEIKAFKPLLEPMELKGMIVTADALQTQVENARFIVEDTEHRRR